MVWLIVLALAAWFAVSFALAPPVGRWLRNASQARERAEAQYRDDEEAR